MYLTSSELTFAFQNILLLYDILLFKIDCYDMLQGGRCCVVAKYLM